MVDGKVTRSVGVDACALDGSGTGIPKYVTPLLEGLCRRFPHVQFYLYSYTDIHFPDLPNVARRRSPKGRMLLEIWRNTRLLRMVTEDGPDAFWAPDGALPLWGLRRSRTVLTIHDLAHRFVPDTQTRKWNLRRALTQPLSVRRAVHNVAVSRTTSRDMLICYGRGADEIIFPPCASRFQHPAREQMTAMRRDLDLPDRFWLSVGTLEPRKNFAALIDAYEACLARGLSLPTLVMVGGNGWRDSELRERVQKAVANGTVRRLGFVDDHILPALYALCEVFFMPSRYEGFGMPILEAQMCGAPVVHGSHSSMVEASGGLGISVNPDQGSIERLMEQMARGEAPLACRLPTDPTIQTLDQAVAAMASALNLPTSAST